MAPDGAWSFQPVQGDPFAPPPDAKAPQAAAPSWKFEPVSGDPFAQEPAPSGSNRTAWKHLPMAQVDDDATAPTAATPVRGQPKARRAVAWAGGRR